MVFHALVEDKGPGSHDALLAVLNQPWAPVRELWGTDPAAQAGQRAMMALAGGPAPPRDPSKRRPREATNP